MINTPFIQAVLKVIHGLVVWIGRVMGRIVNGPIRRK